MAETGTEIVASRSQQGLTAEQEAFVSARLGGASLKDALAKAGYAPDAWLRVVGDPAVLAALEHGVKAAMQDAAIDAFTTLKRISLTGSSADRVRSDAARTILLMAGHVPPMREKTKHKSANLADMNADALRALVDQIQGELGARATPVGAPNEPTSSDKRADLLA